VKYPPNQLIASPIDTPLDGTLETETQRARYIFRIVSGSCKAKTAAREFILTEGATIGEIPFLNGPSIKAYDVITEETTFVCMIDGYYLNVLFQYFPALAGKFYRWIATVLCSRLNLLAYI